MKTNLSILVFPIPLTGHVNPCIGLAQVLRSRGHKIIFIVDNSFKGKLTEYGFEEEIFETVDELDNQSDAISSTEMMANAFIKKSSGIVSSFSSIEKRRQYLKLDFMSNVIEMMPKNEVKLRAILDKHKPDVLLLNHHHWSPTLIYSGKPWVYISITNPIGVEDEFTPPECSGYPTDSDSKSWTEFRELNQKINTSVEYNEYLKANGFPTNAENRVKTDSPFLNIYGFPKELDYTDIRPVPHKWLAVDSFMRTDEEAFEMPVQLKGWDGKLIYLSLGSIVSLDIELMKRLVNILSKSKHKFIVSKGLSGDKYELAANMWGQRSVPQTKVLPFVDLVITHGGNNTVTETFTFGKPMIVLPVFVDQFDNAQRVQEKGFGVRLDPYLCSDEELLNSIELLLNDKELKERLSLASKRMQCSDSLERAADKIESLVNLTNILH